MQLRFLKKRPHEHADKLTECLQLVEALSRGGGNYFPSKAVPSSLQKVFPTLEMVVFCLAGGCSSDLKSSLEKLIYGIGFSEY